MLFPNKIAVVTGGARGIGLETARRLAAEGAQVIVADVDEPQEFDWLRTDVTHPGQVTALFAEVRKRHQKLDILVANAGLPYHQTSLTTTEEQWDQCLNLNLRSAWLCAKEAHALLLAAGAASIVTVASAQGLRSTDHSFPYSAAKGGLLAMTRSLAVEYAPDIRVNAIIPGQVESVRTADFFAGFRDPEEARRRVLQTFPLRRLGTPADIANAIAFLASDQASWITGTCLFVDGGRDAALPDFSDLK